MTTKGLVYEIGTEEIPAGYLPPAARALREGAEAFLVENALEAESVETHATPRRLVLLASGLPDRQEDRTEEVTGPPWKAAFDADGNATKAAQGFARGRGLSVSDLRPIETERGPYAGATVTTPGRNTADLLAAALPRITAAIPFPKTMRWGPERFRFARPIRWLLALFGDEVIPFAIEGVPTGRYTHGHRTLARGPFEVPSAADYESALVSSLPMLVALGTLSSLQHFTNLVRFSIQCVHAILILLFLRLLDQSLDFLQFANRHFSSLPMLIALGTLSSLQHFTNLVRFSIQCVHAILILLFLRLLDQSLDFLQFANRHFSSLPMLIALGTLSSLQHFTNLVRFSIQCVHAILILLFLRLLDQSLDFLQLTNRHFSSLPMLVALGTLSSLQHFTNLVRFSIQCVHAILILLFLRLLDQSLDFLQLTNRHFSSLPMLVALGTLSLIVARLCLLVVMCMLMLRALAFMSRAFAVILPLSTLLIIIFVDSGRTGS